MTFRDFVTGEVLTAANLEQYVMRQNGKPVGIFRKSGTQSLVTATDTALTWDTEDFDTDAGHSTVSNTSRYTPPTAGKYRVYASIEFAGNATGVRDVWFQVNGGATAYYKARESVAIAGANTFVNPAGIIPVTFNGSTDYVECYARQTSGGGLNVATGSYWAIEYVSE